MFAVVASSPPRGTVSHNHHRHHRTSPLTTTTTKGQESIENTHTRQLSACVAIAIAISWYLAEGKTRNVLYPSIIACFLPPPPVCYVVFVTRYGWLSFVFFFFGWSLAQLSMTCYIEYKQLSRGIINCPTNTWQGYPSLSFLSKLGPPTIATPSPKNTQPTETDTPPWSLLD
ncbi:hypothetical protein BKA57DRAFT_111110 [Linnemannia elongata]|nr:hypothetical protein BKA57DRAFT_111110 [Linnemannia elongata]